MHADELERGVYVQILRGEFTGLHGWVLTQRCEGLLWTVAVSDRLPGEGGLYQWFSVNDVMITHRDEEQHS